MLHANPNLKRLADLLGSGPEKMVRGEWRKSPRGKTEMVGYATHALQPEHMAGFEFAAVLSGDDTLQLDWLRRALDGGIRHRQYAGQERQGRGPLVLVRDESGSMLLSPMRWRWRLNGPCWKSVVVSTATSTLFRFGHGSIPCLASAAARSA